MGKHKIRYSKTCQNCGAFVEKNFCPGCGQENTGSRHSFHHLFTHFIFHFLHYDNPFWRTTKTLFLSPGKLSLEYMNGKRKTYVNPFSFYIFISFVTFFIPSMLTYPDSGKKPAIEAASKTTVGDSIVAANVETIEKTDSLNIVGLERDGHIYKIVAEIAKNMKDEERGEKAIEFFIRNLPKALFIYMPIFAFWVWMFHNKRRHYYFDSGIFTLHFFSIALLSITLCIVADCAMAWLQWKSGFRVFLWMLLSFYITFYFFRGNRVFFGESRLRSNVKAFFLMAINTFFILVVLIGYSILIAYKIYT